MPSAPADPPASFAAMQVNARHAKARNERHWHIGGSMILGAAAAGILAATLQSLPWLAFAAFVATLAGIWAGQGPLLSWPAVFLSGPSAASGECLVAHAYRLQHYVLHRPASGALQPGVVHQLCTGWCAAVCVVKLGWDAAPAAGTEAVVMRLWRAGFALVKTVGTLGGFSGPYAIGLLADAGPGDDYTSSVLLLGAFLVTGGLLCLALPEKGAPCLSS